MKNGWLQLQDNISTWLVKVIDWQSESLGFQLLKSRWKKYKFKINDGYHFYFDSVFD